MLNKEFSRKTFLKGGGALIVGFSLAGIGMDGKGARAADTPYSSSGPPDPELLDSWLTIHANNTASIKTGHVELGQGSGTGILMIAAEELDMNMSQLFHVRHDTNVTPDTGATGNDGTISRVGNQVRGAAVTARQELLKLASGRLGVPIAGLTVASGVVSGGGGSVTYGELIGDKLFGIRVPASFKMTQAGVSDKFSTAGLVAGAQGSKPVSQYKVVATEVPRIDIPAKIAGTYVYVHNVRLPGMLHGRVVRPRGQGAYPSGAAVLSIDEGSIKNIVGARVVRRRDFVGVVAPTEYAAIQAAAQLKVSWADPPKMSSSGNLFKQMRQFDAAGMAPARIAKSAGDVDRSYANAPIKLDRTYMSHYAGHGPIGPLCAVADVNSKGAVIFSNTKTAYATRAVVAQVLDLPPANVRIIYYEGSSSYGGGETYEDVAGAAAIMSQIVGKPVRLQFMRWDDHGWDSHGLPMLSDFRGAVDENGKIVAYEHTAIMQSYTRGSDQSRQLATGRIPAPTLADMYGTDDRGWQEAAYIRPNRRLIVKSLPVFYNYLMVHALRGVSFVPEAFATEQFIDELAFAAKMDAVEFRQKNLNSTDGGRWSSALEAIVKMSRWESRVSASKPRTGEILSGRGIAMATTDSTTRAVVAAEIAVSLRTGRITVRDIYGALNAGLAVYPDGVRNQMIGCLVTGTSRALYEQVAFDTKRVTSLDWVTYGALRFKDAPRTHVQVVQWPNLAPTGVGEPTLVPVAAAIANAFFDATGVRIREAPMTPARVRAVLKAASVA
jgi:CO/xanthine dehydrogenase Mo-binding subunit